MKTHIYYLQALNVSSREVVVETAISMTYSDWLPV